MHSSKDNRPSESFSRRRPGPCSRRWRAGGQRSSCRLAPDAPDAPDAVLASRASHPRPRLVRGRSRPGTNQRQARQVRQDAGRESRNQHDSQSGATEFGAIDADPAGRRRDGDGSDAPSWRSFRRHKSRLRSVGDHSVAQSRVQLELGIISSAQLLPTPSWTSFRRCESRPTVEEVVFLSPTRRVLRPQPACRPTTRRVSRPRASCRPPTRRASKSQDDPPQVPTTDRVVVTLITRSARSRHRGLENCAIHHESQEWLRIGGRDSP